MPTGASLDAFLKSFAGDSELRVAVGLTVQKLAAASRELRNLIVDGTGQSPSCEPPTLNAGGDVQKHLDLVADRIFLNAMKSGPVAFYASEELPAPVLLDPSRPLAVAIDPLDGSSNVDMNLSIGTIFSIIPAPELESCTPDAAFLQPGERQLAAGFFVYGPQLTLVLTVGSGTHAFVHSNRLGGFVQTADNIEIPPRTSEFAVNGSNYRHWDEAVRLYIDDCLAGEEGPRGRDFNTRWIASLVAEAYRIFMRGGVYLYPRDQRQGYGSGRLRLVYEANPIALLAEQAGGGATDGVERILALTPASLHQRVPLVFGSTREVERIARYHTNPSFIGERSPLFGNRGLFRA